MTSPSAPHCSPPQLPVFQPREKIISLHKDLTAGSEVVMYTATDPDTERKQTVWYEIGSDPAGWFMINKQTGQITVKSSMDRESGFVQHGKYTALILVVDNDDLPATGTGTLVVEVKDVNDHPPTIRKTSIFVCNQDPVPVLLPVLDGDGPGFSAPFSVELLDPDHDDWTAEMSTAGTGVMLKLKPSLLQRNFNVVLRVCDSGGLCTNNTIFAQVNEENCVTRGSFCVIKP